MRGEVEERVAGAATGAVETEGAAADDKAGREKEKVSKRPRLPHFK